MDLKDKTVLITGGGTGIGEGCALALARAGCRVAVCGRREEPLQAVAAQFDGEPAIIYRTCDVGNRDDAFATVDWATEQLGRIDILLNSAGTNIPKRTMEEMVPEDWDRVLQINVTGTYNMMHRTLPQMRQRQDGLIINISSISGMRATMLGGVAYNSSKFAMTALSTSVGIEEKDRGVRVTNIYPGEVETPILDKRPVPVSTEHRAKILQPEDVAAVVLMVAELPPRANVPDIVIKPTNYAFS